MLMPPASISTESTAATRMDFNARDTGHAPILLVRHTLPFRADVGTSGLKKPSGYDIEAAMLLWNKAPPETTGFPHRLYVPPSLAEALADIDNLTDEAHEEGFDPPSDDVISTARGLLRSMYRLRPKRFEVYSTPEGEIAIVAPGGLRRSVMALCDPKGGVLCMVNLNGNHRRARYSNANGLPDGFFREALADLEGG